ncbi:MAG: peptidase MA family metallohydrolase [Chloroflexota bacterium]
MKHRFVLLLGMMILLLGSAAPAVAQSGVEVTDVQVQYTFGMEINFIARVQSSIPIQSATITFRAREGTTQVRPLTVSPDGIALYRLDTSDRVLRPFTEITFSFQFTLTDGTTQASPSYHVVYADNRFAWQDADGGMVRVHWYQGDAAFGQAALDAARAGLQAVQSLIPFTMTQPIDVYVYATADDLQGALYLGGSDWVAGHADPDLGVVMVSVPPGPSQGIAFERQIPHELAHVLLYRQIGPNAARLPHWLDEGIASLVEQYPNPDYESALAQATNSGALLPLSELCTSFPPDAARAFLAYAESESFTRFLFDQYGTSGLAALTSAYADGLDCEQGARRALGVSLTQLEARWREAALGENRAGVAARNLLPYVILLGLMLMVPVWGALGRLRERRRNGRKSQ